jgi:predicted dinucleotide-binding enzyme
MNVSIVGNGNMAKGIATRLLSGGHSVTLHVRDQSKGDALKNELQPVASGNATISVFTASKDVGDVLIPTVHFGPEMEEVAKNFAEAAKGKIVVDISNPVDFKTFQLIPEPGIAGADTIAALFPGSLVVKAFNTILAATLTTGQVKDMPLDVFIAGDDAEAKKTVAGLVIDGGMRPLDVGPLANARHLEGFGLFHITLQDQVQGNWATSLKIVG